MKKIKTIEAVKAYGVVKGLKLSAIEDEVLIGVWKSIKALRPIAEEFDKSNEEAKKTLQDDEFTEMQTLAGECMEREKALKESGGTMTDSERADVEKVNGYFNELGKKGKTFFDGLAEKEVEVDVDVISADALLKILKANEMSFADMESVAWMTE